MPDRPKWSVAENVQAARNPQEAIFVLAQALDLIIERLDEQGAVAGDSWGSWNPGFEAPIPPPRPEGVPPVPTTHVADIGEQLRDLQAELAEATDELDKDAIHARIRLLLNPGTIPPPPDHGRRSVTEVTDDGIVTTVPEVDEERKSARRELAKRMRLADEIPSDEDLVEAYVKGGPLWLYYGNRDFVMTLPDDMRKEMCEDVLVDSKTEGRQMAADVLKVADPGAPDFQPDS